MKNEGDIEFTPDATLPQGTDFAPELTGGSMGSDGIRRGSGAPMDQARQKAQVSYHVDDNGDRRSALEAFIVDPTADPPRSTVDARKVEAVDLGDPAMMQRLRRSRRVVGSNGTVDQTGTGRVVTTDTALALDLGRLPSAGPE